MSDPLHVDAARVETLAARQLEAYNRADLDAFCACYHPDVQVYDGEALAYRGREAMREAYGPKFAAGGFGATVDQRLVMGRHCVDREQYWVDGPDGRREASVLVRYTLVDDALGIVQFLR